MHKRGQITIFIILGIFIIGILGIIFYLYNSKTTDDTNISPEFDFSRTETIKKYIEGCIEKAGNDAINLVGKQGGEINPGFYQNWRGDKIGYLCYTTEYSPCYNKKPFLKDFIEEEITMYSEQKVGDCFKNLENEIKSKGYEFSSSGFKLNTSILPDNVLIEVNYPFTITSNTGSQIKQDKFTKNFNTPLGRLISIGESITSVSQNTGSGSSYVEALIFENNGEIEIISTNYDDTDIYITNLRNDKYKFQFAVQTFVRGI